MSDGNMDVHLPFANINIPICCSFALTCYCRRTSRSNVPRSYCIGWYADLLNPKTVRALIGCRVVETTLVLYFPN